MERAKRRFWAKAEDADLAVSKNVLPKNMLKRFSNIACETAFIKAGKLQIWMDYCKENEPDIYERTLNTMKKIKKKVKYKDVMKREVEKYTT